jgi:hypothetical protein
VFGDARYASSDDIGAHQIAKPQTVAPGTIKLAHQ